MSRFDHFLESPVVKYEQNKALRVRLYGTRVRGTPRGQVVKMYRWSSVCH